MAGTSPASASDQVHRLPGVRRVSEPPGGGSVIDLHPLAADVLHRRRDIDGHCVAVRGGPRLSVDLQLPTGTVVASTSTKTGSGHLPRHRQFDTHGWRHRRHRGVCSGPRSTAQPPGPPSNDYGPVTGTVDVSGTTGDEGDTLTATGMFGDPDGTWAHDLARPRVTEAITDNGDGTWTWSLATTDDASAQRHGSGIGRDSLPRPYRDLQLVGRQRRSDRNADDPGGGRSPRARISHCHWTSVADPSSADTAAGLGVRLRLRHRLLRPSCRRRAPPARRRPDGPATRALAA